MSERRAAIIFLVARAPQTLRPPRGPARGIQRRAEQKNLPARATYRREERTRSRAGAWQMSCARPCSAVFSCWPRGICRSAKRSTRWRSGALPICLLRPCFARTSGRPTRHLHGQPRREESKQSMPHVSPSTRPAAGVTEARAHPAQRIGSTAKTPSSGTRQRGQPVVDCWYHSVH